MIIRQQALILLALVVLALTFGVRTSQAFTVPNDDDYFVFNDGYYEYIYTAQERAHIHYLVRYNRFFREVYEKEFNWKLDETPRLIIPSDRNQISNGFATVIPSLFTVFYMGGPDLIDYFSSPSWAFTLLSHEVSHLYQLNVKRDYSKLLKTVFGNPNPNVLPPFTYTIYPNAFLPTFIMEGNSTMNEGRFGAGGRLYSGHSRALLLQLLRANRVTAKRLMNDHMDFPYGGEKYLIGGFFQLFLAEKYGAEKVNNFFYEHAYHMWNPLRVDLPFRRTFGIGYETAISEMNNEWRPLAERQQSLTDASVVSIGKSQLHTPMTRSGEEIFILGTDGASNPKLYKITKDGSVKSNRVNLPLGRVFRGPKNQITAASAEVISNDAIKFGLFKEGYGLVKGTEGRAYYDLQGEESLYAIVNKSFLETQLYHNNKNLGATHSSAVFGQDKSVYYFKQEGKRRTLIRGEESLYAFDGYYGFPVDADKEGNVYFIAPTEMGSGLFKFDSANKKVERVLQSDTVIDAKIIFSAQKAVVTEVTDKNFTYKLAKLKASEDLPFVYTYEYESENEFTSYRPPEIDMGESVRLENEKKFSHLANIKYTGMDPFIFIGLDGKPIFSANLMFSDPFLKHNISLGLGRGAFDAYTAQLLYTNRQYEVSWLLGAVFKENVESEYNEEKEEHEVKERFDTWTGLFGLNWPFFQRPQWEGSLASTYFYTYEGGGPKYTDRRKDNRNTVLTQALLSRVNAAPLGFYAHQKFAIELAHEYINNLPGGSADERIIYGGEIELSQDIFRETYLGVGYQAAKTDSATAEIELDRTSVLTFPAATRFTRVSSIRGPEALVFYELQKLSADFRQAVNLGIYFTKFPLSLRRLSLIAFYNEFYGTHVRGVTNKTLFHEYGYGSELELLLLHMFPLRILILDAKASVNSRSEVLGILSGEWRF